MKIHTQNFKNELPNMGRQIDSIITYENTILHDELYGVSVHYEGNILKSVMKQLDIESSVSIPIGTTINYQLGVKIGNNYEYLNYGNYIVYSVEKIEDANTYKIICYDKLLNAMKEYEDLGVVYPITVRNYINALCNKIGLTFKDINTHFANYEKEIQNELYLDADGNSLGYTYRDVLDELAQVTASIICIDPSTDNLQIKYLNNTNDTINEDYLKDVNVKFGEKYGAINTVVLSRSAGADNIYYPQTLPEDIKAIKISDNQIMNWNDRDTYLPAIYDKLNGLEYYINNFSSIGILYYELGDFYNINVGEQTYKCLMLNDEINVTQGIDEIIHTEIPEEAETDYSKADKTDRRINQTYLIVDKQNQQIQSVINNVTEQNNKISQINQTVNELNTKIQDIADITVQAETIYASLTFTGINQSEPIEVKIRPTINNISYLYPRDNLYPSNTLYMTDRILRFTNTTTNEVFDYELPDDLLVEPNSGIYDEFYLGYDEQICQVKKRCKYNADGTVSTLQNEVINTYTYPTINLTDGNYTVELIGYNNAYMSVRLMSQNIYTTQFATKAELSSSISQTANEINLRVDEKLDEEDFTSANIMLKINNDESSATIHADKINLNGAVTANNNFKIKTDGSMEAVNGTFLGGKVTLIGGTRYNSNFTVKTSDDTDKVTITPGDIWFDSPNSMNLSMNRTGSDTTAVILYADEDGGGLTLGSDTTAGRIILRARENYSGTHISCQGYMEATAYNYFSLESMKKDIKKLSINATEIVKNGEIYEFRYTDENNESKKHIGFIIPDKGGNYKTPEYVISNNKNGIDSYNTISIMWKALQEQQEQIEQLQKQIKELKGE